MNSTENFLSRIKDTFLKRVSAYFILYLLVFFIVCLISFVIFASGFDNYTFYLSFQRYDVTLTSLVNLVSSQIPLTITLAIVFVSVFTTLNRAVSVLICVWYGTSVGCAVALASKGCLYGLSQTFTIGMTFDFISLIMLIFLMSCSAVYSVGIIYANSCEEFRLSFIVSMEYLKLFLFFSGAIYTVGFLSAILF